LSDWITKDQVRTMRALAEQTGFNENCVSRILDLAVLSPEIADAIFRGDRDPSFNVAQLIANLEIDLTRQKLPDRHIQSGKCGLGLLSLRHLHSSSVERLSCGRIIFRQEDHKQINSRKY
jgi:hypothetical protein